MIDPKQKAELIVEKFYSANQPYTFEPKAAKECAKIAVNEILDATKTEYQIQYDNGEYSREIGYNYSEYWQEVLNELNNL